MPATPRPVRDEREMLLTWLGHVRYMLRLTAYGLSDDQARATPTRSELSIGGLIKHSAAVERGWMNGIVLRDEDGSGDDDSSDLHLDDDESLADVLAQYVDAAANTDRIVGGITDLGQRVPVPEYSPLFGDVDAWSVRWVLEHLIVETARHTGHADIIRESLDGATAFPLLATAESWPAVTWLTPWASPT